MIFYADSSFLFTLYVTNPSSLTAAAWMQQTNVPLTLTSFGVFELRNALRAAIVRRTATATQVAIGLTNLQGDIMAGRLVLAICNWEAIHARADRLSGLYTSAGGHRALDILHVAVASILGVGQFLTFDARQSALAAQAGLAIGP